MHSLHVDTLLKYTKKIYNTCKGRNKNIFQKYFCEEFYINACHVKYSSRGNNAIWYAPW